MLKLLFTSRDSGKPARLVDGRERVRTCSNVRAAANENQKNPKTLKNLYSCAYAHAKPARCPHADETSVRPTRRRGRENAIRYAYGEYERECTTQWCFQQIKKSLLKIYGPDAKLTFSGSFNMSRVETIALFTSTLLSSQKLRVEIIERESNNAWRRGNTATYPKN